MALSDSEALLLSADRQRAVGLFSNRSDAEYALSTLVDADFPMSQVSVIAKNGDVSPPESTQLLEHVDKEASAGAVTGTVLGGITGLVVGLSTLAIPGFGPILLLGEIASTLATTAVGAGVGAACWWVAWWTQWIGSSRRTC